jgi:hypothetical protein
MLEGDIFVKWIVSLFVLILLQNLPGKVPPLPKLDSPTTAVLPAATLLSDSVYLIRISSSLDIQICGYPVQSERDVVWED